MYIDADGQRPSLATMFNKLSRSRAVVLCFGRKGTWGRIITRNTIYIGQCPSQNGPYLLQHTATYRNTPHAHRSQLCSTTISISCPRNRAQRDLRYELKMKRDLQNRPIKQTNKTDEVSRHMSLVILSPYHIEVFSRQILQKEDLNMKRRLVGSFHIHHSLL